MFRLSHISTLAFALWGLLHLAGAAMILARLQGEGAGPAYALYGHDGSPLPAVTGAVLGYFSWLIGAAGLAALALALTLNRRNSEVGLALNTALTGLVETGLVLFLLLPGHLSLAESLPGLVLAAAGITLGGIACRRSHAHAV